MRTKIRIHGHVLPVEMGDFAYTVGWGRSKKRISLFLVVRLQHSLPGGLSGRSIRRPCASRPVQRHRLRVEGVQRRTVGSTDKKFAFRLISPLVMLLMERPALGLPTFSPTQEISGIGIKEQWSPPVRVAGLDARFMSLWPPVIALTAPTSIHTYTPPHEPPSSS